MTNSPDKHEIQYRNPSELNEILEASEFQKVLDVCKRRPTETRTFCAGKPGHQETIEEWGEVHTDGTGVRAVIFYYRHSTGIIIRSIKRLVTETSNPIAAPKKKRTKNPN